MEKLEMGIAHYFENLTPKADESIWAEIERLQGGQCCPPQSFCSR
jgi:hypothetical protein